MSLAKVRNLKVRPVESVDLCFEMDGILGEQNAQMPMLGLAVTKFDFARFYGGLGVERDPADPGKLKFDAQTIHDDARVAASLLFALRAEAAKALLDKAIAARENSFYQKYKNQGDVIQHMQDIYAPLDGINLDSKLARLAELVTANQFQHDALHDAYVDDSRVGVIKNTTSEITSATTQTSTNSTDSSGQTGSSSTKSHTDGNGSGKANQTQSVSNTDYGYRVPSRENDAQFSRAAISLMDEQFAQFMFSQNVPFLDRVFTNELRAIDLDVKRLQVAYLNTILMSPISGVVTGVFKNLGDCVRAGEPVIRVENSQEVFLVGTLIYRGLVAIGSTVTVTTQIFDSPRQTTISGKVVSVRGHDSKDDEWNVLVRCSNTALYPIHAQILPVNYNFDYDDTSVEIV